MIFKIKNKERKIAINKYRINPLKKAPSKGAQELKDFLLANFKYHTLLEEFRIPTTLYRVDFIDLTLKVAYEFNDDLKNGHHSSFNKFFHRNRVGYKNSIKRDIEKYEILLDNGIQTIEIYSQDLPLTLDKLVQIGARYSE